MADGPTTTTTTTIDEEEDVKARQALLPEGELRRAFGWPRLVHWTPADRMDTCRDSSRRTDGREICSFISCDRSRASVRFRTEQGAEISPFLFACSVTGPSPPDGAVAIRLSSRSPEGDAKENAWSSSVEVSPRVNDPHV